MGLVTMVEILDKVHANGTAVPAFDAIDHASVEAIIKASESINKPVIIMVPEAALPLIDVDNYFEYLTYRLGKTKVPVALELDHGKSFNVIMKAIHAGFTGVMIDGSDLPIEENISLTRKIVEIAHAAGVSVEGEIGHVAGGEGDMTEGSEADENMYTKPEDAKRFVEETGVDALAVAIGTVHGVYKGTPKLDYERLKKIKNIVNVPLVLHGGSGVAKEDFVKAVENGINKVNLFTEISMAAVAQSINYAQKKQNKLHFAELVLIANKTVNAIALDYLKLLSLDN
jgi:fructose-bisphosphate aldolase class II